MIDSENLCRKAMEIYGFPAQAAMVVEECSELTNALSVNLEEVELVMMIL